MLGVDLYEEVSDIESALGAVIVEEGRWGDGGFGNGGRQECVQPVIVQLHRRAHSPAATLGRRTEV